MTKLLNVKQIAELLQIHEKTIYKWIKKGRFPKPVKTWGSPRWEYEEILKYLRNDDNVQKRVATSNLP